jgi:hypothetical protein
VQLERTSEARVAGADDNDARSGRNVRFGEGRWIEELPPKGFWVEGGVKNRIEHGDRL